MNEITSLNGYKICDKQARTQIEEAVGQIEESKTQINTLNQANESALTQIENIQTQIENIQAQSAGSATQPIYFNNGEPIATTYALNATVPSGAKFTDTTYSAATTSAAGLMSASDKKKLNATTDYIVAQGTSGNWHYIKYNNGIAICYGKFSATRTINQAWGGIYECSSIPAMNLPFNFTEIPLCIPSYISNSSGGGWIAGFELCGNATSSSTPSVALLRGSSSADELTYNLGWFVIGKWK